MFLLGGGRLPQVPGADAPRFQREHSHYESIGKLAVLRAKALKDADRFDRTQQDECGCEHATAGLARQSAGAKQKRSNTEAETLQGYK